MRRSRFLCFLLSFLPVFFACNAPQPVVHEDELASIGHYLFFDTRLSYNQTKSCGSCHDPNFAFTDGYRKSITASGDIVRRNAPTLINVSKNSYFDWADPHVTSLSHQIERPLFNTSPVELGLTGNEDIVLQRFSNDTFYTTRFRLLFPDDDKPVSLPRIREAIVAYVNRLSSMNAPYDRFTAGDSTALTPQQKRGMHLFFSKTLNCASCHPPPYFTLASMTKNPDSIYFNAALSLFANRTDPGLAEKTGLEKDRWKFKIPTLRNIALTSPYAHDGSISTLEEVIDIYASAGHSQSGKDISHLENKARQPTDPVNGFTLSPGQKKDLVSFLYSLTDSTILHNPFFKDPFRQIAK